MSVAVCLVARDKFSRALFTISSLVKSLPLGSCIFLYDVGYPEKHLELIEKHGLSFVSVV